MRNKNQKNEILNQELRREILEMRDRDQEMLAGQYDNSVIRKNTARVKEIINQYGWLGISEIGADGSEALWLLVQHSDHDLEFQRRALELLRAAVKRGEASKRNLAYLIDRVRVNSGEKQLFGTQFQMDKLEPEPIENPELLEKRRQEYGLEPLEEYRKKMAEIRNKSG